MVSNVEQEIEMNTKLPRRYARPGYRTLSTEFYEEIKRDIITCKLRPGEMISQKALIERYQASKTPLREALKLLTQEGLVQPLPSRGYLVAPITMEDVRELFEVRQILEMAAIERAAKLATEEQLAELEKLVGESHILKCDETSIHWYMTNLEFHVSIAAISGNPRLAQMLRGVLEDLSRAFVLDLDVGQRTDTEAMVETHMEIVKALRSRDGQLAKDLSMEEINRSLKSIEESLAISALGEDAKGGNLPVAGMKYLDE